LTPPAAAPEEKTTSAPAQEAPAPEGTAPSGLHEEKPKPAAERASEPAFRLWTDASGKHSTEAILVDHEDGNVRLKKKDGSVVTLSIEQLSDADQEFVRSARAR